MTSLSTVSAIDVVDTERVVDSNSVLAVTSTGVLAVASTVSAISASTMSSMSMSVTMTTVRAVDATFNAESTEGTANSATDVLVHEAKIEIINASLAERGAERTVQLSVFDTTESVVNAVNVADSVAVTVSVTGVRAMSVSVTVGDTMRSLDTVGSVRSVWAMRTGR